MFYKINSCSLRGRWEVAGPVPVGPRPRVVFPTLRLDLYAWAVRPGWGSGAAGCCLPGRAERPLKLVPQTPWVTMHAWVSLPGGMRGCLRRGTFWDASPQRARCSDAFQVLQSHLCQERGFALQLPGVGFASRGVYPRAPLRRHECAQAGRQPCLVLTPIHPPSWHRDPGTSRAFAAHSCVFQLVPKS